MWIRHLALLLSLSQTSISQPFNLDQISAVPLWAEGLSKAPTHLIRVERGNLTSGWRELEILAAEGAGERWPFTAGGEAALRVDHGCGHAARLQRRAEVRDFMLN